MDALLTVAFSAAFVPLTAQATVRGTRWERLSDVSIAEPMAGLRLADRVTLRNDGRPADSLPATWRASRNALPNMPRMWLHEIAFTWPSGDACTQYLGS
ncbi:hypothetical protein MTO96_018907 [Rhipicephalus appendiculatus]